MPLEATPGILTPLVVASIILAVAAFVLFLDFRAPVYRAFALLLVFKALALGLFSFSSEYLDLGYRLRFYAWIALPFAALHFALAYRRRHRSTPSRTPPWIAPLLLTCGAAAFEIAYLLDPSLVFGDADSFGPFAAFGYLDSPTLAFIALFFVIEARGATATGSRSAFLAAALGLSLQPLFYGTFRVLDFALDVTQGRTLQRTMLVVSETVILFLAFACVIAVILFTLAMRRNDGTRSWLSLALWGACIVTGATIAVLFNDGPRSFGIPSFDYEALSTINTLWILGLPILVTYALVRYRLFDADVRLRFAITGTTLGAVFIATFLIVGKLTESWAERIFGQNWVGGAVAAGLLLFAISPLQHLAERLAHRAVPGDRAMTHLPKMDRLRIYREQLEVAWQDGMVTPKERLLFGTLQRRLGLSAEEAMALENEVVRAIPRPGRKANARRAVA